MEEFAFQLLYCWCFQKVAQGLALLPHRKKISGSIPEQNLAFLCEVCIFSPVCEGFLQELQFRLSLKHVQKVSLWGLSWKRDSEISLGLTWT